MSARGEGPGDAEAPDAGRERADAAFLGRWSRRKRDGAGDASPPDRAAVPVDDPADPAGGGGATPAASMPEPPGPTDADMPPLESLTGTSDVSAFLSRGVSASLRRAALRRVFRAPEFNVRDGLNDYDGDFTAFAPLGDTLTCDMKFRTARLEREAAEREGRELEALESEAVEPGAPDRDAAHPSGTSAGNDADARAEGAAPDDAAADGAETEGAEPDVAGTAAPPTGVPPA